MDQKMLTAGARIFDVYMPLFPPNTRTIKVRNLNNYSPAVIYEAN